MEGKSMQNGARYVVTTHWGTFSLDEGAYQDYLAGTLWLCWTPGKPAEKKAEPGYHIPPHVSDRALDLSDMAEKAGVLQTLSRLDIHEAIVPYSEKFSKLSIDELNLTVRSSNGLKRAGALTFSKLYELLQTENGLLNVRNIGQKSIKEIKQVFFEECYSRLLPYEKAQYWQDVLDHLACK